MQIFLLIITTFFPSLLLPFCAGYTKATSPYRIASTPNTPLQWLTLEQALEKNRSKPKKILVDIYTDWCGWCKKMDKQVYANPEIIAKLNQHFYVVKLNAEHRQPITIHGITYRYLAQYKAHELALALLKGQMRYPSTVFLNEKQQVMQRVPGFIPAKDFLPALTYLSEK